jgi:HEAT repeat protein
MLGCKSPEVQREAIRVLSIIGGLEVSPNIRRQLSAHDWTVRHAAALALGDIKDREASIDLKNALKDGSKRVRLAAASSLVKIDGRGALPNLVEMMYNTYWQRGNWQRQAASILAQITTHDDVPSFKAMCRHENFNAVAIAVEVLAYTIGAETIPFIREIMAQADWRVRPAVIRAFTVAANEDFLPELQIILETDRGYEARLAALALQRLGRRDAMPDLSTLVYRCFAPHEEEQTADVLTQIVTDEDFECLQEMLKDSHWYKRLAAIPAMAKIRGREAFPGLKNITDNGRAMEKRWAVKAMAPLADRSDWDYFFGLLENMDADIRATAACVIGRLGLERDLTPVAEMAMHHLSRGIYEGTAQALLILDRKLYCPFEWLGEIVEDDHV